MSAPAFIEDGSRLSWGRASRPVHQAARPRFRDQLSPLLGAAGARGWSVLAGGLARSYGDSGLNPDGGLIDMTGLDRFLAFDAGAGVLRAEAGVSLSAIARLVAPAGWFPATVPGTRFVTLGGAIANDIHGKNHHRAGAFGRSVRRFGLLRSDRGEVDVDAEAEPDLFAATIGGLGLTGIITWAEVQLSPIPSSLIDEDLAPFERLDDAFDLAAASADAYEHTVAWVDAAGDVADRGRGVFSRGEWAAEGGHAAHDDRARLSAPALWTGGFLNTWTVRAFNSLYYRRQARRRDRGPVPYAGFFFPLDGVAGWNRLYGPEGFHQYQCVVPPEHARESVRALVEAAAAEAPPLAVLKTFGDLASPGMLSFPRPGATLALDLRNRGAGTIELLARLDAIVREAGGRLYPAKDGRMPAEMFRTGYPAWERFAAFVDPAVSSAFWRRVAS